MMYPLISSKSCFLISLQLNVKCAACNHQASSGFHLSFEFQQPMVEKMNPGLSDPFLPASISSKVVCFVFQSILRHQYVKGF